MTRKLAGLVAVGLIVGSAACQPGAPSDRPETTLAAFQLYASGLVVATTESEAISGYRNCLDEAGLSLSVIKRSRGPEIGDALVSGSASFGTLAVTPQVLQTLQGEPLVVLATLQTSSNDIKVLGHRSAGVLAGDSLRGRTIGYVGGTYGEIFLERYLTKHGMVRDDVSLVSAGPAQLRDLFLGESLDVIVLWEPAVQDILLDPSTARDELFIDVDTTLYTGRINLVARPEVLEQEGDQLQRLIAAFLCGEDVLQGDPAASRLQLEAWLDRSPGSLEGVFDAKSFHVQLDVPALQADIEAEAAWAQASVFDSTVALALPTSQLVDTVGLAQVDPDRIVRQ